MAAAMARGWARSDADLEMLFCDLDAERAASPREGRRRRDARLADRAPRRLRRGAAGREAGGSRATSPASWRARRRRCSRSWRRRSVAQLNEAFPGVPALRVMPNQPAEVGRGVLCYVPPEDMEDDLSNELIALLGALGTAVAVPEDRIDAAMAVMSCAPAYVALFAEALAAGGERNGLEPGAVAGARRRHARGHRRAAARARPGGDPPRGRVARRSHGGRASRRSRRTGSRRRSPPRSRRLWSASSEPAGRAHARRHRQLRRRALHGLLHPDHHPDRPQLDPAVPADPLQHGAARCDRVHRGERRSLPERLPALDPAAAASAGRVST